MTLLKLIAKKSQLEAIMLTVLDVSINVVHAFVLQCLIVYIARVVGHIPQSFCGSSSLCLSIEQMSVLQANTAALKMYTKLGYKPHHTSPSQADPVGHLEEPTGYEILSLPLGNK